MQDIRFAIRVLLRAPAVTVTAFLVLALGIGATTAIFSVASGVLIQPLPFREPEQLVQFGTTAVADLEDCRTQNQSFESIVTYSVLNKNLQNVGEPERIATVAAERGLFDLLGTPPIAGRTFRRDDAPSVAVVSERFWNRQFGRNTVLNDRTFSLDGEPYTVIGVMPEKFQFPYRAAPAEIWIPMEVPRTDNRWRRIDAAIGRLKPGVGVDTARTELATIAQRLETFHPQSNKGRNFVITPLSEAVVGRTRTSLLVLLGAVAMVLLIACANVMNLLLARSESRKHEVAVRTALGAGRQRLVRQFLTESVLLAMGGGVAGLLVTVWGTRLLINLAGPQIPRASEISLDWRVFLFLAVVSVLTGIAFGLAPALTATRDGVTTILKESGRGSAGRGSAAVNKGLVVVEIALAFILLIGTGLMLRAFLRLENTPTGFVAQNVLTLRMDARFPRGAQRAAETEANAAASGRSAMSPAGRYFTSIEERVLQIPGVRAAGFSTVLPMQGTGSSGRFVIAGRPAEEEGRRPSAGLRYVTPGYFKAMGIPLKKGRLFTDQDHSQAPPVVLVNEVFATQYFPNQDPIGNVIVDRGTIIGVVGNVRQSLGVPPSPEIYYTLGQASYGGATLAVSGQIPSQSLVSGVRSAIRDVNPNQAVYNIKTMEKVITDSLADLNLYLWLLGLFAALALILSSAGIYGVVSYAVAARRREFGIRLALGADRGRLLRLVLGEGGLLIGIGLTAGIAGALALTRFLRTFLYSITPTDPLTFVVVTIVLAAVAIAACAKPARRALNADPAAILRYE